jgi:site-specific DNA recombinase
MAGATCRFYARNKEKTTVMKKNAILYTRVSTDEQNNGYSPADQKDKLIRFCENQDINIVGIYHDDESGKSFNRPEWKKIILFLKSNKGRVDYIYFLKWDRFSRNAPEAYAELSKLDKLGVEARAMEQPLNLEIPEQKVLLAIYLTTPEVDNDRRALNIFHGIRRARKEGRWMGSRPLGYRNARDPFNKPIIVPEGGLQEELVKKAFQEFSTGLYSTEELRKKYVKLGLKTSKNGFWNLLRNKAYIGKVLVPAYKNEPDQWVDGIHVGIIDESIFYDCQDVIEGRKRKVPTQFKTIRPEFPLRGFLLCPLCEKTLTASTSKGRNGYYSYYHCIYGCPERHKAEEINHAFEELLKSFGFEKGPLNLLAEILKKKYLDQNRSNRAEIDAIKKEIDRLDHRAKNARALMLDGEITSEEYRTMKNEIDETLQRLNVEHHKSHIEINDLDKKLDHLVLTLSNLENLYKQGDVEIRRRLIGSIFPNKLIYEKNSVRTVDLNPAVELIFSNINSSRGRKKEKHTDFGVLSHRVESEGFEPSSKQ